jgi:hypothetical protein
MRNEREDIAMQVTINLPDDVAKRAQAAGLLTVESVQNLLEEAMRRAAGKRLLTMAEKLHTADIAPLSDDELDELIHEVRAERKATDASRT